MLAVGAVVFHNDCILLVQRKLPPSQGQWAIPGGKVQLGETLRAAAEREILEETGVTIRAGEPIYTFELIEPDPDGDIAFHYVIIDLMAEFLHGEPTASDDASTAAWVDRQTFANLPVNTTTQTLLRQKFHFP